MSEEHTSEEIYANYYIGQILSIDEVKNGLRIPENLREYKITIKNDDGYEEQKFKIGRALSPEDEILFEKICKNIDLSRLWLHNNDYKHNKYLRGDYTEEEWTAIKEEYIQKTKKHSEYVSAYRALVEKYTTPETTE